MTREGVPDEPKPTPITRETTVQHLWPFERSMVGLALTDAYRAVSLLREWFEACPTSDHSAKLSGVLSSGAPVPADQLTPGHVQPGAQTKPRISRLADHASTCFPLRREE